MNWKSHAIITIAIAIFLGCDASSLVTGGDSKAIRTFHGNLKIGTHLSDAIINGEKAQHHDIKYRVFAGNAEEGFVEIGRYWQEPYIRITERPPDPKRTFAAPYQENGYATRDDFAKAVKKALPAFYSSKKNFRFTFNRYQGNLNSDSFTVEIDTNGIITSISPVNADRTD